MGKHFKAKDSGLRKRGLTIEVRPGRDDKEAKSNLEHAIKTMKRRLLQEGMTRDVRRKEYFESKGELRRKAVKEAQRRAAKARRLAR